MRINECSCGCGGAMGSCMMDKSEMPQSYMFFGNLKTIKRAVDTLLSMDQGEIDAILNDGHDWAADHIASSKDDISEVTDFFVNAMEKMGKSSSPEIMAVKHDIGNNPLHDILNALEGKEFVKTFEGFVSEAKKTKPVKKKAVKKKKDLDADGDTDFADAKIAQYKAGGIDAKSAYRMSRKFDK